MRPLYNILFGVGLVLSAPYYLLRMWRRGSWREGFRQRFGEFDSKFKQALTNRQMLWLHAVSVGEVNLCTQLIRALEPRVPNAKLVVSTTTSTGMAELRRRLPAHIEKIYYPIDRRQWVARALQVIHPEAVILVEAEIWPNFMWRLRDRRIPVFLVNARLSERSFRGYRRFGWLFRPLFASLTGVGAQTEADAARLRELGCRPEAIHIVGSLKFDAARVEPRQSLDVPALLGQLGWPADTQVLVAGSTHAGEELLLAGIYQRLRLKHPRLRLILVPRHFERGREVGAQLESGGLPFVYRSQLTATQHHAAGEVGCLLVNTTGELRSFYERADVVFIGKSLAAHGGQNPIEAAALGKAVVFGPNMENFAAIAASFVAADGAVQVRDAPELEQVLDGLLADEGRRRTLGANARRVVDHSRGALDQTIDMILPHLHAGDLYVAPRAGSG